MYLLRGDVLPPSEPPTKLCRMLLLAGTKPFARLLVAARRRLLIAPHHILAWPLFFLRCGHAVVSHSFLFRAATSVEREIHRVSAINPGENCIVLYAVVRRFCLIVSSVEFSKQFSNETAPLQGAPVQALNYVGCRGQWDVSFEMCAGCNQDTTVCTLLRWKIPAVKNLAIVSHKITAGFTGYPDNLLLIAGYFNIPCLVARLIYCHLIRGRS